MKWWIYWRGRYRMWWGFCPWCFSSPPDPYCVICLGTHRYGRHVAPVATWRRRWDYIRKTNHRPRRKDLA